MSHTKFDNDCKHILFSPTFKSRLKTTGQMKLAIQYIQHIMKRVISRSNRYNIVAGLSQWNSNHVTSCIYANFRHMMWFCFCFYVFWSYTVLLTAQVLLLYSYYVATISHWTLHWEAVGDCDLAEFNSTIILHWRLGNDLFEFEQFITCTCSSTWVLLDRWSEIIAPIHLNWENLSANKKRCRHT